MEYTEEMHRLYQTLEVTEYKYLNRLLYFRSTLDITVQDFICMVAFLGNQACHQFAEDKDPFPHVYAKANFLITSAEQQTCCELINAFAGHLRFQHKLTKSVILSAGNRRYAEQRADFLMWVCDYLDQVLFSTPPSSPVANSP